MEYLTIQFCYKFRTVWSAQQWRSAFFWISGTKEAFPSQDVKAFVLNVFWSKSNQGRWVSANTSRFFFPPFRYNGWGRERCGHSPVDQCPEVERPSPGLRSWSAADPGEKGSFPSKERERKSHTKAVQLVPYQRLRGRVEKRETETDQPRWIPPERLLNCVSTTSRRAPRLMEPARGVGPITAAFPPAAGQWRRAFLVRGRSRLLSLAVVCGLWLVRAPIWAALGLQFCSGAFVSSFCVPFRVRVFFFFFFLFFAPRAAPGWEPWGSEAATRPPPLPDEERARRRERGCDGCGEGDSPPKCRSFWKTPRSWRRRSWRVSWWPTTWRSRRGSSAKTCTCSSTCSTSRRATGRRSPPAPTARGPRTSPATKSASPPQSSAPGPPPRAAAEPPSAG